MGDEFGRTELHVATKKGITGSIQNLIKHGTSVNAQDVYGCTGLHWATRQAKADVVNQLLKAGASINSADKTGSTCLHLAVWHGHTEVMRQLLNAGASVNGRDGITRRLLLEFTTRLTGLVSEPFVPVDKRTVLHIATRAASTKTVRELIQAGASIDVQDHDGWTALHMAVYSGHSQVMVALLKAGASVDVQTGTGKTCLHMAIGHGNHWVIEQLLSAGANINSVDEDGRAPLHISLLWGSVHISEMLIRHGADLAISSKAEGTLLSTIFRYSKRKTEPRLIRLLLLAGYTNRTDTAWLNTYQLPTSLTDDPELVTWLRTQTDSLPTLRQLCRATLRKHLSHLTGRSCTERQVAELPLPFALKDFILFKDLDDGIS